MEKKVFLSVTERFADVINEIDELQFENENDKKILQSACDGNAESQSKLWGVINGVITAIDFGKIKTKYCIMEELDDIFFSLSEKK